MRAGTDDIKSYYDKSLQILHRKRFHAAQDDGMTVAQTPSLEVIQ
jgi:hypothetical protein